eukprot:172654-Prymnesium_polylepis.1
MTRSREPLNVRVTRVVSLARRGRPFSDARRVCHETFAALPSLGRGGHFRRFSPTFGVKVLSQPWGTFAGSALKSGSLSLTTQARRTFQEKGQLRHQASQGPHIFYCFSPAGKREEEIARAARYCTYTTRHSPPLLYLFTTWPSPPLSSSPLSKRVIMTRARELGAPKGVLAVAAAEEVAEAEEAAEAETEEADTLVAEEAAELVAEEAEQLNVELTVQPEQPTAQGEV